jgi:hypothetical protein
LAEEFLLFLSVKEPFSGESYAMTMAMAMAT